MKPWIRHSRRDLLKSALAGVTLSSLPEGVSSAADDTAHAGAESVLFSFDDRSIPLWDNLQLTMVQAKKHPANPVVRRGPAGSVDHGHCILYGSVIRVGDVFRMWYLAMGQRSLQSDGEAPGYWRPMCYAESRDGVHWTKPDLGLVDYNGNRNNNICLIESSERNLTRIDDFLTVMYEPTDRDPEKRYKVVFIAHVPIHEVVGGMRDPGPGWRREGMMCAMVCATSGDGLRWRIIGDRPSVDEHFEVSGLYRFGDFYYASGQQFSPWTWRPDGKPCGRVMVTYRSPDLIHWSSAKALGFARPGQLADPPVSGQQTHMGAGIWNRGNTLIGIYGMWQDGPANRPKGKGYLYGMRVDLGLIVSNDGVHFREPVPGFSVITRGAEREWDSVSLLQGHAFANVGDQTYIWYSHWDNEDSFRSMEIGLATLRRDGFGYLGCHRRDSPAHFVTRTIEAAKSLALNLDDVGDGTPVKVQLLDKLDRPLPGYSRGDAALLRQSGTHRDVVWPKSGTTKCPEQPFAVRVDLPAGTGKVYAIYVIS